MNREKTMDFVDKWNVENNLPLGEDTMVANMRYVRPGVVTWNEYDAPDVDIEAFVAIYNSLIS